MMEGDNTQQSSTDDEGDHDDPRGTTERLTSVESTTPSAPRHQSRLSGSQDAPSIATGQAKPRGRTSLRKRTREKSRREAFNVELGLMADVLVRIDPGLREEGGSPLRNRVELLETAAQKLRSIHQENEANKRTIDRLIAEGAVMPTTRSGAGVQRRALPPTNAGRALSTNLDERIAKRLVHEVRELPLSVRQALQQRQLGLQRLAQPATREHIRVLPFPGSYVSNNDMLSRRLPQQGPVAAPRSLFSASSIPRASLAALSSAIYDNHVSSASLAAVAAGERLRLSLLQSMSTPLTTPTLRSSGTTQVPIRQHLGLSLQRDGALNASLFASRTGYGSTGGREVVFNPLGLHPGRQPAQDLLERASSAGPSSSAKRTRRFASS